MIKLLHTADLHLKAPPREDSDYSLACLKVILATAYEHGADAMLFCGDIFDAPTDYQDEQFIKKVVELLDTSRVPIIYIPGNHEDKSGDFSSLESISFGAQVSLITGVQIKKLAKDDLKVEILCIPHHENYEGFSNWKIPSRQCDHRIAIAHGEVPGFTFLGDEEGAGVLNPSIFSHFQADQVFLGHIHLPAKAAIGDIDFYYSGSPRVVRRSETGVRGVNLLEIGDEVKVTRIELPEVGVVRRINVSPLDNSWAQQVRDELEDASPNDRVKVTLEGMIEKDTGVVEDADTLKQELLPKFRRVEIEDRRKPIDELTANPFFEQIYNRWKEMKPADNESYEYRVWINMTNSLEFARKEVLK